MKPSHLLQSLSEKYLPQIFGLLIFLSLGAAIFPLHNWDLIAYVASAKSYEENDPVRLQAFAYSEVQKALPEDVYNDLAFRNDVRRARATDPRSFAEHLPFYQIRPIYNGLNYLLYKAGLPLTFAPYLVTSVAIALAIFLIYRLTVQYVPRTYALWIPGFLVAFDVLGLARRATPDGLSFLAITMAIYLLLQRRYALLLGLMPLIIGVRTDIIFFTTPLACLLALSERKWAWAALVSWGACVAAYVAISAHWHNAGWSTVFYFTLIGRSFYPLSEPVALTFAQYIAAVAHGTLALLFQPAFLMAFSFLAGCLYRQRKNLVSFFWGSEQARKLTGLLVVCLVYIVARFLAFPVEWTRFYAAPYLFGCFALLALHAEAAKTALKQ